MPKPKALKAYEKRIEAYHRRAAVEESRQQLEPDIDGLLLRVLPPDHPERRRIEGKAR